MPRDFGSALRRERYPIRAVCRILGISRLPQDGGIRHFTNATRAQLMDLVRLGAADLNGRQNDSPTLRDLLAMMPGVPWYRGYVIYPPREDARVTIEALMVSGLTLVEADALLERWTSADALEKWLAPDGTWCAYAWWD